MANSELENYLAKLLLIRSGIIAADSELHKLAKEHVNLTASMTGFSRPKEEDEVRLQEISKQAKISLESIIVELFNLSEIRKKFLNRSTDTSIQRIISALQPCIDALDANGKLICDLRNNIVAHGEIQKDVFRGATDIFKQENEPYRKIYLTAKFGCMYISALTDNLVSETVAAKEILKIHMISPPAPSSDYFNAIKEARSIQASTIDNLKKSNLNRECSFVGADQ